MNYLPLTDPIGAEHYLMFLLDEQHDVLVREFFPLTTQILLDKENNHGR